MSDFKERINKAYLSDKIKKENKIIQEEEKRIEYLEKIKELTPRIKKLIDLANVLIKNGYYHDFLETSSRNDYKKGFQSEGWCHNVGFIIDGKGDISLYVTHMGIVNGGCFGENDFRTNGEDTYMSFDNYSIYRTSIPINLNDAKRFLNEFDNFEKRFYEELEEFLSKKGV